jgi:hypothetical protein
MPFPLTNSKQWGALGLGGLDDADFRLPYECWAEDKMYSHYHPGSHFTIVLVFMMSII